MTATEDFVGALTRGAVRVLVCRQCGWHQTLDPLHCQGCGSATLEWADISGGGRVYATTAVHRAPSAEFQALVPYILVLVDLDDGGRMMGHGETGATIGAVVRATIFIHASQPLIRFASAGNDR